MGLIKYIIIALLISGCTSPEPAHVVTTTTTLFTERQQINKLQTAIEEHIWETDYFKDNKCYGINRLETVKKGDPGDYEVIIEYDCGTIEDTIDNKKKVTQSIDIKNWAVVNMSEPEIAKRCNFNAECIPTNPAEGFQYLCENGVCKRSFLNDTASLFCKNNLNRPFQSTIDGQIPFTICKFPNGDQCEIWSYYYGHCGWNTSNSTDCSGYRDENLCQGEYFPVCAKIKLSHNETVDYELRSFNNRCNACKIKSKYEMTESFILGTCTPSTTTTIKIESIYDIAAKFCEENGYSYRRRKYLSGKEYGVCVFDYDDECDADEYFHGRCGPSK